MRWDVFNVDYYVQFNEYITWMYYIFMKFFAILTSRPWWMQGKACWNLANLRRSLDARTLGCPTPAGRTCSRRSRTIWNRKVAISYMYMETKGIQSTLTIRISAPGRTGAVPCTGRGSSRHLGPRDTFLSRSRVRSSTNEGKHGWNEIARV